MPVTPKTQKKTLGYRAENPHARPVPFDEHPVLLANLCKCAHNGTDCRMQSRSWILMKHSDQCNDTPLVFTELKMIHRLSEGNRSKDFNNNNYFNNSKYRILQVHISHLSSIFDWHFNISPNRNSGSNGKSSFPLFFFNQRDCRDKPLVVYSLQTTFVSLKIILQSSIPILATRSWHSISWLA